MSLFTMNNLFKAIYHALDTLLHTNIIHIGITKNENDEIKNKYNLFYKEELRNLQSLGYIDIVITESHNNIENWEIKKNCSDEEIKKIKSWYEFISS